MSQENVEMIRRTWEAVRRGDIEPALDMMAPEVEMDLTTGGRMDADIYWGPDGVRAAYQLWASSWESLDMEAKEITDLGDNRLIVQFTSRGHSSQTGLDFEMDRYWVYAMRRGRVVRIQEFETRQQALKAVGLEE
jgi:ketosteroid isomerase-like protein